MHKYLCQFHTLAHNDTANIIFIDRSYYIGIISESFQNCETMFFLIYSSNSPYNTNIIRKKRPE